MMRRVRTERPDDAAGRPARGRRPWSNGRRTGDPDPSRPADPGPPDPDVERNLLSRLERAGSRDVKEEAALALAEYYLDAARPLEALCLFEKVSLGTSDRERRELSDYFLRRLDGKRLEELSEEGNGGPYGEVLEQIFYIYLRMGNSAVAARYLRMIIDVTDDPDVKANCLLSLGQISERGGDYARAIAHYAAAIRRPPGTGDTWYLLNNNMGRCLNACGRYREAEGYCRRAISIDPSLHYARETLAVSLRGQGRVADAVRSLVRAVEIHPLSPGALGTLEELVASREEIAEEIPGIAMSLDRCRKLAKSAKVRFNQ